MMGKSLWLWVGIMSVIWIAVILLPLVILPVCTPNLFMFLDEAAKPHGCTRTLYMNTLAGVAGLAVTFIALKRSWWMVSALFTMGLGLIVILLPTVITGVCRMESMRCVWGTKPGLIGAGIVVMAAGFAGVMMSRQKT